jgi:hypothetical protein
VNNHKGGAIHYFAVEDMGRVTACGRDPDEGFLTSAKSAVTCKMCLRILGQIANRA